MPYYSDEEIYTRIKDYLRSSNHPDFNVYRDSFIKLSAFEEGAQSWLWRMRYFCEVGKFRESRILEVGCGFGWEAVAISMIGNNQVLATDILTSMIETVNECLASINRMQTKLDVTTLVGDICTMKLEPGSFDGIYCSEAIEHVRSLDMMFDNCHTLLKPGRRLLIVNDSNRFNTSVRSATFQMWKERDSSWEHAEFLKTVRPVEHRDAKPYAVMREEIIRRTNPDIATDVCAQIVAATAGLSEPQIIETTRNYRPGTLLPTPPPFSWCRNPVTGEYAERLLDPFEIAEMLRKRGFKAQILHAFRRFPFRLLNAIAFRPLNVGLFNLRPAFVVVAEKTADHPRGMCPT
jgi:2-polyprenyl-3-methyl-5-hydroxy-6-metoxy-1,4-benzoquinol methylase